MPLPIVAIVGRPNVGKSSLFNRFAGERLTVVDATPGVTRDRVGAVVERDGHWFELFDTGGMGIDDRDGLTAQVEAQVAAAMAGAAAVLFVVDVRAGITDLDESFARQLRGHATPVLVVANKADAENWDPEAAIFHRLGLGDPHPASAREGRGMDDLMEALAPHLGTTAPPEDTVEFRVALVGARNAGKSTMVNALAHDERVIVSEIPGTTRDAVDVAIRKDGKTIVLVDTAGFRKRAAVDGTFEFYSQSRSEQAIYKADVVCLLLDCTKPIGKIQKQLAQAIIEARRPCVIVANKWDLAVEKMQTGDFGDYVRRRMPNLHFAPIVVTTATEGKNALAMLDTCAMLLKQADHRIPTGELNRLLREALDRRSTPIKQGKVGKILYATQAGTRPPTVVCFVNEPQCFTADYQRYLVNQLQAAGAFPEVPVRLRIKQRRRREGPPPGAPGGPPIPPRPDLADYEAEPSVYEVDLGDGGDDGGGDGGLADTDVDDVPPAGGPADTVGGTP